MGRAGRRARANECVTSRAQRPPSGSMLAPLPARTKVEVLMAGSAVGVDVGAAARADGGVGAHGVLLSQEVGEGAAPDRPEPPVGQGAPWESTTHPSPALTLI